MTSFLQNRMTVALAVAVPCAVALWLLTAAAAAISSAYVLGALLVISLALIGFNVWNNGQPGVSMTQVIRDAELTPVMEHAGPLNQAGARRGHARESRRDARADAERVSAVVAFSIAVTGALLFYAWLT